MVLSDVEREIQRAGRRLSEEWSAGNEARAEAWAQIAFGLQALAKLEEQEAASG